MAEFKRTYIMGRSVLWLLGAVGWVTALVGCLAGLAGGGMLWSAGGLAGLSVLNVASAIGGGLALVLLGLAAVAGAQHMRSSFDMADMTREILMLTRRGMAASARTDARSDQGHDKKPNLAAPAARQAKPARVPTLVSNPR